MRAWCSGGAAAAAAMLRTHGHMTPEERERSWNACAREALRHPRRGKLPSRRRVAAVKVRVANSPQQARQSKRPARPRSMRCSLRSADGELCQVWLHQRPAGRVRLRLGSPMASRPSLSGARREFTEGGEVVTNVIIGLQGRRRLRRPKCILVSAAAGRVWRRPGGKRSIVPVISFETSRKRTTSAK